MFPAFEIMFTLSFLMFFAVFFIVIFQNVRQWNRNNQSPRLTVDAKVIAKRTNVSRHHSNGHTHRSTTYYVTFEVESGDRMELKMQGCEYGLLIEGDTGKLTFQGTRYLEFQRQ